MTKPYILSPLRLMLAAGVTLFLVVLLAASGAKEYLAPDLPDVTALRDMRLQVPLRIYTRDGRFMAQFGEQRRIPLPYEAYPKQLINALIAAEDDRFFEHGGLDYAGLLRAIWVDILAGESKQGGSTITMLVAKNYFLTPEKQLRRKLRQFFLALQIEEEFSKEEILTLFLNKVELGHRAFGFAAAAEVYFGKTVDQLTLPEMAIIAGLPNAPSRDNPISNPELAAQRRAYVLRRMREKDFIDEASYQAAMAAPVEAKLHGPVVEVDAQHVAEMVRVEMLNRFGPSVYTDGYRVVTTLDSRLQQAAVGSVRVGLIDYDQRHGYRGPAARVTLPADPSVAELITALDDRPARGGLEPAIVLSVDAQGATAFTRDRQRIRIGFTSMQWARPALTDGNVGAAVETPSQVVAVNDIIYVAQDVTGTWRLAQVPQAQAAFVAVDPRDGAIVALVGGFDYTASNFNRAVQAKRQPGSSIKPFLYSAALEQGFTPSTIVLDAPYVTKDSWSEGEWKPQNFNRNYLGPIRLREALVNSRNTAASRIMEAVTPPKATQHMSRFGFAPEELPPNMSLALGATQVAPLRMAAAYSVFANGGYRVEPYFIERIEDPNGKLIFNAQARLVCTGCGARLATEGGTDTTLDNQTERSAAITPQNAYVMTDLMTDVVRRGTATRALALKRNDIAGKTGSTQDGRDAWFCGFNADIVGVAWVGFDQERPLGPREEGGRTALPIWVQFMAEALKGQPEHRLAEPSSGLVRMRVSATTGKAARPGEPNSFLEVFLADHLPEGARESQADTDDDIDRNDPNEKREESLF